ncbi:MAG: ABC transporter substrate-binding protein, partial [Elusimicrobia bacterium]|nr:ABC transporter substrate-binding protein [Elusimicrobiota bacterium]
LGAEQGEGTVKLGYFIGGRTTLFGRAFADGYFDKEGVRVELITRRLRGALMKVPKDLKEVAALEHDRMFGKMTGTEIVAMIERGELDGGLIGDGTFQEAAYSGKPIVAVALLGHDRADAPGHGIVLRKGIKIRNPGDFTGLKLITRRAGPGDLLFLKEFLRREGIPEKTLTITDQVDDDRIHALLKTGKADGGYMHLMTIARLVKEKDVYVYRPMNWVNPEISLVLLVFRKDFLQGRRDLAVKTVAGYMKRIAYERSLPAHKREKTRKDGKTGIMALDFQGMSLPVYDYPPRVRIELLEEMQKLMATHGLLKGTTDLSGFVDTAVVEEAWSQSRPARGAEPGKPPVRLGYFLGGRTNLFGRAFADGYFDKEGVPVELTTRWLSGELLKMPKSMAEVAAMEGKGQFSKMTGRQIVEMISRGELDGGLVGEGTFIEAAHSGIPIMAVALLGHDRKDAPNHGIVLRKDIVIHKPEDFAGLKLITRRAGPSDAVFLREFLRREGIPEKSVTIMDQVENDRMKPMLRNGEADGGYMHLLAIDSLIRRKVVYVYRPMNWVNPEISLALLVFRRDFLDANRELVEKLVAGYMKRIVYEQDRPDGTGFSGHESAGLRLPAEGKA